VVRHGRPLTELNVNLYLKEQGIGATDRVDDLGQLRLRDAPAGWRLRRVRAAGAAEAAPGGAPAASRGADVPPKYFNAEISGLRFEVKRGKNEFPLDLVD
jgi:hypothetical protein